MVTISSMQAEFQCAACGEWNETSVDAGGGHHQVYVEDCQVCCRPNLLTVEYDAESEGYQIRAELES